MKIAILYFTYKNDWELLEQSLKALPMVEKRMEDELEVFVVDESCNPLPKIPDGVNYSQSCFDRQKNLNGVECVEGMLTIYKSILEQGFDWLIKIDCDTVLNSIEWLRDKNNKLISQVGTSHKMPYNSGSCYAVSLAGINAMLDRLQDPITKIRADKSRMEDKTICTLSKMNYKMFCVQSVNDLNNINKNQLYLDWMNDFAAPLEQLEIPCAVAFKRCFAKSEEDRW